jgi:hypothetical protein
MQGAHSPIVCSACGVVHSEATSLVEQLRGEIADLELDMRKKRAQIRRLTADQYSKQTHNPRFDDSQDVLEFWRETLAPNTRELRGERTDLVLDRLEHYSVAELKECVMGYAEKPYMVNGRRSSNGTLAERKVEAKLIFRDADHVDRGIAMLAESRQARAALNGNGNGNGRHHVNGNGKAHRIAAYTTALGFSVFPCRPGEKVPATVDGFQSATRDPERVVSYWSKNPDANVGVATGKPSNIVVIDVDGDDSLDAMSHLRSLESAYGDLPPTLSAVTPSGGQHFYFAWPGVPIYNRTGLKPGIDVRGDGGYVLVKPSEVDGRPYEWDERVAIAELPEWLLRPLLEEQRKLAKSLGSQDWAKIISAGADQGQRNDRLCKVVGHLFHRGHGPQEVMSWARVLNANVRPPLDDRELEKIVQSIAKRHQRQQLQLA